MNLQQRTLTAVYLVMSLCVSAGSLPAAEGTLLRYQFKPGQFVHYEVDARSMMVLTAREQTQTLRESRKTQKHFRVVSVDEEGTAVIEPVIDHVVMEARSDDEEPVVFDSDDPSKNAKDFKQIQETVGRPTVQIRYSARGELDELLPLQASKADSDPDPGKHSFLVALPEKPAQVGDKWNDDYWITVSVDGRLRKPLTKKVRIRRLYTLKQIEDGVAEIEFRTYPLSVEHDPQVQVQLVQQSLSGAVKFDIRQGLIVEWKSSSKGQVFDAFGPASRMQAVSTRVERVVTEPASRASRKLRQKPAGPAGPQLPGGSNLQAASGK